MAAMMLAKLSSASTSSGDQTAETVQGFMSAIIFSRSAIMAWSLAAMSAGGLALSAAAYCGSCACAARPGPAGAATSAQLASTVPTIPYTFIFASLLSPFQDRQPIVTECAGPRCSQLNSAPWMRSSAISTGCAVPPLELRDEIGGCAGHGECEMKQRLLRQETWG